MNRTRVKSAVSIPGDVDVSHPSLEVKVTSIQKYSMYWTALEILAQIPKLSHSYITEVSISNKYALASGLTSFRTFTKFLSLEN